MVLPEVIGRPICKNFVFKFSILSKIESFPKALCQYYSQFFALGPIAEYEKRGCSDL